MILRAPMAFGAATLLILSLFYGVHLLTTVGDMPAMTDAAPRVIDAHV